VSRLVGSEMCIRDRHITDLWDVAVVANMNP
jgi:hypothetical protein